MIILKRLLVVILFVIFIGLFTTVVVPLVYWLLTGKNFEDFKYLITEILE